MGRKKSLLAKLLTPKKKRCRKSSASSRKPSNSSGGWRYKSGIGDPQTVSLPDVEPFVVPEGPWEQHVFIYDGRPLKGTRKGSRFMLDVVPGKHTMMSVYTKTEWSSCYTVAYKGQLIGHVGDGTIADHLVELVNRHGRVLVHAKRMGTDPGGWPLIELLVPYGRRGDPEADWLGVRDGT